MSGGRKSNMWDEGCWEWRYREGGVEENQKTMYGRGERGHEGERSGLGDNDDRVVWKKRMRRGDPE